MSLVGHLGGPTQSVVVEGDLAYLGEGAGLTILDVSDPLAPLVVGKTALMPEQVEGFTLANGYAYVADGHSGVRVVDVSVPQQPLEVGDDDGAGEEVKFVDIGDASVDDDVSIEDRCVFGGRVSDDEFETG